MQWNDKKITEATKDVSAFANSNGGVLIYGISEDKANRHLPGSIDPVDRKVITDVFEKGIPYYLGRINIALDN